MELENPNHDIPKDASDPLLSYLADKGYKHEERFFKELQNEHQHVIEIDNKLPEDNQVEATLAAMNAGADVIFQACLRKHPFRGFADFLIRTEEPSALGEYSYIPWDTKLAKSVKPYFIIQLCCYSEMLEGVQGVLPGSIGVVLGTNELVTYSTSQIYDYYLAKKSEFYDQQDAFDMSSMPDPFEYNEFGQWTDFVQERRIETDHLSLVANITRTQIAKLEEAGISTCDGLANTSIKAVHKLPEEIFKRLQAQASIQKESEVVGSTQYAILPNQESTSTGLTLLPPHDSHDLFWDLEGYPLADDGLEYLWGCSYFDGSGKRLFWERWAHDHEQEKAAFTAFIQFAYQRWRDHSDMHVYHYGHYEITVCQRLMGRYGVCEFEVDELLRNDVFIDLYKIVRHGLLIGEPKYSIKNVERLYRPARKTEVASGSDSIVEYGHWRDIPDGETWEESSILSNIRDYNIDDCDSTQELVGWLREVQSESGIQYQQGDEENSTEEPKEPEPADILQANLLELSESASHSEEVRFLARQLAYLVRFHHRANKPMWWRFFERSGMSYAELHDDADCIVDCQRTDKAGYHKTERSRNIIYEYTYDVGQEFRNKRFKSAFMLREIKPRITVDFVDTVNGIIGFSAKYQPEETVDVIADEHVPAKVIEDSIFNIGERFLAEKGLNKLLADFLLRRRPDTLGFDLNEIENAPHEEKFDLIIEAIKRLDNSIITIQGPPGTGKTYTATRLIRALLKDGKTIGVTSNSHEAINNVMSGVATLLREKGDDYPLFKIQKEEKIGLQQLGVKNIATNSGIKKGIVSGGSVVGATAWGFSRPEAQVDYLFIDEAGQVALANLTAMSTQATNIVCLGDQMQLPQPVEGSHPEDSGLSILDYFLKEHPTVPPDMGIFLDTSYRMHHDVNQFISDAIYEGRLANAQECNNQRILVPETVELLIKYTTGIQYDAIDHSGRKQTSPEEISHIAKLVSALHKCRWQDRNSEHHDITPQDIMIVAPFNYQVNELKKVIGESARIGTVDLFQGQEAPVIIVSMTSSVASESARGVDFLLNKNRINVAISRAQALAIVVSSSTLLEGSPSKIADIQRYNLFYKLKVDDSKLNPIL